MSTIELPNKMSSLLRLAVKDAQACEADPRYVLMMGSWHEPARNSAKCAVCMAGAVMAQTIGVTPLKVVSPYSFTPPTRRRLEAIDDMRCGGFDDAYLAIVSGCLDEGGRCDAVGEQERAIQDCEALVERDMGKAARAPWETYLQAADILEKVGL